MPEQEPAGFMSVMQGIAEAPFKNIAAAFAEPEAPAEGLPAPPTNPVRRVQQVASGIMSIITMPMELLNTGFAVAASALLPSVPFPAATLGSLYIGPPHGHLHPPSLIPPSPVPIPLPSLGPMLLGTSVKVLVGGLPAARAGDIVMPITCCSLVPGAATFTGSSKVFFGGTRAARQLDMVNACMRDAGGPVRGVAAAMMAAGQAVALTGVVADAIEAESAADPNLSAAYGVAAAMGAAQMAADAAALAMSMLIGSDPAVPPLPGMIATMTNPIVQVGGFPMINLPDPAQWLFGKAKNKWDARKAKKREAADGEHAQGCPTCPH
jgi:uncharacterized Zn-binding protein involved in type VI secretion